MELRPLGTLTLETASDRLFMLGSTPAGNRIVQEIKSAELVGDRIKASMKGLAAADWLSVNADGLALFDIRMTLETADGALLYLSYTAKADWSAGLGKGDIYAVAQFETGDDRYRWLNTIQIVGKGGVGAGGSVAYEWYELV